MVMVTGLLVVGCLTRQKANGHGLLRRCLFLIINRKSYFHNLTDVEIVEMSFIPGLCYLLSRTSMRDKTASFCHKQRH